MITRHCSKPSRCTNLNLSKPITFSLPQNQALVALQTRGKAYDYKVEDYERLRDLLHGKTELSRAGLTDFVVWKSNRNSTQANSNSDHAVRSVTAAAFAVEEPMLAMRLLCCLRGVSVSVASAILAFVKPTVHAVIDQHKLRALGVINVKPDELRVSHYEEYLSFLERERGELTLRELEQGLFMWSRKKTENTDD